jgi:hypothetical protein
MWSEFVRCALLLLLLGSLAGCDAGEIPTLMLIPTPEGEQVAQEPTETEPAETEPTETGAEVALPTDSVEVTPIPAPPDLQQTPRPLPTTLARVPVPEETPVTGEAPTELLEAVLADIAAEVEEAIADFTVERAEEVIWPDGSLGCPRPDEVYTQALVRGYWIVVRVGELTFDYRATEQGHFRRCSTALIPGSGN